MDVPKSFTLTDVGTTRGDHCVTLTIHLRSTIIHATPRQRELAVAAGVGRVATQLRRFIGQ